jgi:hypothetical protein
MIKSAVLWVAAIAVACVFGSCSAGSDTVTNGTAVHAFSPPHIGTMLVLGGCYVDTAGVRSALTWVGALHAVANGETYRGRTNVTRFQYDTSQQFEYLSYEPNGNISILGVMDSQWRELPVESQGYTVLAKYDTSATGTLHKNVVTCTYVGTAQMPFQDHTFNAVEITERNDSWTNGVYDKVQMPLFRYHFSPETGWYIRFYSEPDKSLPRVGYLKELLSYELK